MAAAGSIGRDGLFPVGKGAPSALPAVLPLPACASRMGMGDGSDFREQRFELSVNELRCAATTMA